LERGRRGIVAGNEADWGWVGVEGGGGFNEQGRRALEMVECRAESKEPERRHERN
jgi:hypothetical protein